MKRTFRLLSDAKKFQRQKRKEGFKTRLVNCLGIANPYRIVEYSKKPFTMYPMKWYDEVNKPKSKRLK